MCESETQLCQDINLKWNKDFTLLGITYDNKLSKAQDFVSTKVEEIKKVLNLWRYRSLDIKLEEIGYTRGDLYNCGNSHLRNQEYILAVSL